ncbi:hypothetical protein KY284_012785 [Solanum tuberosum]|nr:hypothetical protein KY284_012785 [Solanum tuberosum]
MTMDNPDTRVIVDKRDSDDSRPLTNVDLYSNNSIRLIEMNSGGVVDENCDEGHEVINDLTNMAWRAKEKALKLLRGDPAESYAKLLGYLYILEQTYPGYVLSLKRKEGESFLYAFVALEACIRGWEYCGTIVVVDGAALRGAYGGTMLTASTMDPRVQTWIHKHNEETAKTRSKLTKKYDLKLQKSVALSTSMRVIPSTLYLHAVVDGPKRLKNFEDAYAIPVEPLPCESTWDIPSYVSEPKLMLSG